MQNEEKIKSTVDMFIGEVRKACHAMIDQGYISDSPVKLVQEALDYLDSQYIEQQKQKKEEQS